MCPWWLGGFMRRMFPLRVWRLAGRRAVTSTNSRRLRLGLSLDPKPQVVRPNLKTKTYFTKKSKMPLYSYPTYMTGTNVNFNYLRTSPRNAPDFTELNDSAGTRRGYSRDRASTHIHILAIMRLHLSLKPSSQISLRRWCFRHPPLCPLSLQMSS